MPLMTLFPRMYFLTLSYTPAQTHTQLTAKCIGLTPCVYFKPNIDWFPRFSKVILHCLPHLAKAGEQMASLSEGTQGMFQENTPISPVRFTVTFIKFYGEEKNISSIFIASSFHTYTYFHYQFACYYYFVDDYFMRYSK